MARFPLTPRHPLNIARTANGPTMLRGKGNNNAETPWKFVRALEGKFGPLEWDLAASRDNKKAGLFIAEKDDALSLNWSVFRASDLNVRPLCFLNPPFTNITPWARKCAEECQLGARILLLVPASVGANWFWDWVAPFADVYSVGRMVFDNCYDRAGKLITTVYPKDLVLCHYAPGTRGSYVDAHLGGRTEITRWRWQDGG